MVLCRKLIQRSLSTGFELITFSHINPKVPVSLAYHLSDIYLEELNKVMDTDTTTLPSPAPLQILLQPFILLAAQTPSGMTYKRIQSTLLEPLFSALPSRMAIEPMLESRLQEKPANQLYLSLLSNACYNNPSEEGKLDGHLLRNKLLRWIFEVASQPDTRDSNRRKLYALYNNAGESDEFDR